MPVSVLSRRTRSAVVLAVVATTLLGACGSAGEPDEPVPPVTMAPVIEPAKRAAPAPVVPPRWPLTGVAAADLVERPALAVKIENPKEVRPQTGLDQADVVWEQVVEGGVTRFVAVFHSQVPEEVGPIRSVRPMDPAITAPLRGIIAFSGGQPGFVQALKDAGLQTVSHDAGSAGFYRTKVRSAPHNVFGTPTVFWNQADPEHQAAPPQQFRFARSMELASASVAGVPTGRVSVTMSGYSHPTWDWNAADGTWVRSEGTTAATAASGARLAAANVVVLRVDLVDSGTTDPAGSPVPETKLVGSGSATVASGGRSVVATWTKPSADAPLTLAAADGTEVRLAPGTTWVELAPNGSGGVTVE